MHVEGHGPPDRLQEAARRYRDTRTWPRAQAVIPARQGDTAPQVARALGVGRRAIQSWVAASNRGGLEALPDRPHPGRAPTLSRDQEVRLLERIEDPPRPADGVREPRGADIRRILEQELDARYSRGGASKLPHRLDSNDLMPRPHHPDADDEAQEFLEEIAGEPIAAIAEQHPEDVIQIWHRDQARFGQQGPLTRAWARRGSRPRRRRRNGRESLYVLAATCASSGAAFGLVMPGLDTAVADQFLEEFSRQLAPGARAVLLWDNAPYHVSGGPVVPANVSLIGLLPYSPGLDPAEALWHYPRAHHRSNRVHADYEALLEAATEAWRQACLDPERVRSICAAPYLAERR